MCQRPDTAGTLEFINSTANKYNSSVGQYESENKKSIKLNFRWSQQNNK